MLPPPPISPANTPASPPAPLHAATLSATPRNLHTGPVTLPATSSFHGCMHGKYLLPHDSGFPSTTRRSRCDAWCRATRTLPPRASTPSPSAAVLGSDQIPSPPPLQPFSPPLPPSPPAPIRSGLPPPASAAPTH